jgi:hypothetical protein
LTGHASCLGWLVEGAEVEELPPVPLLGAAAGTPGEARATFLLVQAGAPLVESGKPVLFVGGKAKEAAEERVLGVVEE